jgi:hypothetical protein
MSERYSRREFLKKAGMGVVGALANQVTIPERVFIPLLTKNEEGKNPNWGNLNVSQSPLEQKRIKANFQEKSFRFRGTDFALDEYKGVLAATTEPNIYRLTSLAHIKDPVSGGEATIMGLDFLIPDGYRFRKIVIGLFTSPFLTAGDKPVPFQSEDGFKWYATLNYPVVFSEAVNSYKLYRQSSLGPLSTGQL